MNVSIGGIAKTVEITSFDKLGDVKVCMLTTTADGSVGFEQLSDEVRDTIYASFPVDNAKGSIASFEDGADNVPVRELNLDLVPYQNLNGYDNPWVGGAGKNKLSPLIKGISLNATTGAQSTSLTSATTDYIPVNFTTNPNYYISGILNTLYSWVGAYNSSKQFLGRTGGSTRQNDSLTSSSFVSGTPQGSGDIAYLRFTIYENAGASGVIDDIDNMKTQLEIGSAATSYEPYENICPIYPANGKNELFQKSLADLKTANTAGSWSNNVYTYNSVAFTVNSDGTIAVSGTASAQTDFYVVGNSSAEETAIPTTGSYKVNGEISSSMYIRIVGFGVTSFNVQSGDGSLEATSTSGKIICRVANGTTASGVFKPMIRHAEITDSTYVPYNAIGITRTGKNLFDKNAVAVGVYLDTVTGLPVSAPAYSVTDFIPVEEGVPVFIPASQTTRRWFYTKDRTPKTFLNNSNNQIYTPTEDGYIRVSISHNSISLDTYQIEYGTSATSYEPYMGERYYPTSDNPVYGGTLEVETGVLTVTHICHSITGGVVFYGTYGDDNAPMYYVAIPDYSTIHVHQAGISSSNYKLLSNYFAFNTRNSLTGMEDGEIRTNTTSSVTYAQRYYFRWDDATDAAAINTAFSTNPLQVVAVLETPLVYQLTPVQVKTLLGYNNIWTDSGTAEVQYRANIGLYIQKIIGSSEDDMIANQNIAANQYFFVGEELYYSTSAISAGQTIIVGTNCIKTNLADALNALNS